MQNITNIKLSIKYLTLGINILIHASLVALGILLTCLNSF